MPFKTPLGEREVNVTAPIFIRPLQDRRVIIGQPVRLECQVEGHPEPVIKWLKDGQNVTTCPDYEVIQSGNKHTLLIACAQGADCGRFTLQAMNTGGIKQSTCMLIVAPAPTPVPGTAASMASSPAPPMTPVGPSAPFFIKELRNQPFKPSGVAVLEARVVGVPVPTVEWLKDGKPFNNYRVITEYDSQSGICLLTIPQLFPEDQGEYTCQASNTIGVTICSAYILPKDEYDKWLSNERASFTREKKQRMIARHEQHPRPPSATIRNVDKRGLLSPNFSDTDTAWGQSESETEPELASLNLHKENGPGVAPFFRSEMRSLKLTEGTDAVFQCNIGGNPKPRITWYLNGRVLEAFGEPRRQFSYRGSSVTLKVSDVKQSDRGEYQLILENPFGKVQSSVRIEVFALPSVQPETVGPSTSRTLVQVQQQRQEQPKSSQPAAKVVPKAQPVKNPAPPVRQPVVQQPVTQVEEQRPVQQQPQELPAPETKQRQQRFVNWGRGIPSPAAFYQREREAQIQQKALSPLKDRVVTLPKRHDTYQTEAVTTPANFLPQRQTTQQFVHQKKTQRDLYQPQYSRNLQQTSAYQQLQQPTYTQLETQQQYQPSRPQQDIYHKPQQTARPVQHQPQATQPVHQQQYNVIDLNLPSTQPATFRDLDFLFYDTDRGSQYVHPYLKKPEQVQYELERQQRREDVMASRFRQSGNVKAAEVGKPYFLTKFPPNLSIHEGEGVTLYAKASDDVTKLTWSRDGAPVSNGEKYKIESKSANESVLVISNATLAEGGWYQCEATSPEGTAQCKGRVVVKARKNIDEEQVERVTLRKIDRSKQLQNARLTQDIPQSKEAPKFLSKLNGATLNEGQHALLDVKFGPTDDPNVKVAWQLNGKPILASSRITTLFDFGYAVLEINPVTVFDHGEYTVIVINQLGEVRQSANVEVAGIRSDSVINYIQTQGDGNVPVGSNKTVDRPNFHSDLRSQELFEGQPLHLETKLTPINDPGLNVQFYFNGNPVQPNDHVQIQVQSGFVVLHIENVSEQDGGYYTVTATNDAGIAETSATVVVVPRLENVDHSQILDVEDQLELQHSIHAKQLGAPQFVQQIQSYDCDRELGRSYFEARYEPASDPSLTVQWLKDGNPLSNANRIQTVNSFGFLSLTIHPTYPEDAGTYTCLIRSNLGEAECSGELTVVTPEALHLESLHESALPAINDIDGFEVHIGPVPTERPEEFNSQEAPKMVRQLKGNAEVQENEPVHFECRVQPAGDVKMQVDWFKDGQPLVAAHRFRPMFDFGYIALDILYAYPEDSGTYTCVARNELGETESSVNLTVLGKDSLLLDAQHPEGLERIQELEQPKDFGLAEVPDRECDSAPQFVGDLEDYEVDEHTDIIFDLKVTPVNDPTMVVEWYHNDEQLYQANRFHPLFEFGFVTLRITGVIPEDSGTYTVVARNALGENRKQCNLTVNGYDAIVSKTQHEEALGKIEYLENLNKYAREEVVDAEPESGPQFVQPLPGDVGEVEEGEPLHLECKVEPVSDNTLKVYWLHNGNLLPHAHRFRTFHDFGFVSLDILHVYAEDSGSFTCVAENALGKAETTASLHCEPKSKVLGDTQHPTSVARIEELEAPKLAPEEEPEQEKQGAHFIRPLSGSVQAAEGESIFLEAQAGPVDDNTLTHEWLFNGQPLMQAHRFVTNQDFGFIALNVLYIYPEDSGTYTLIVRNATGKASCDINVEVEAKDAMLLDTFHPSAVDRITELEAPRPAPEDQPEAEKEAPQIIKQLEAIPLSQEATAVHLDAQYTPIDDNRLQVEWLFNGQPLKHSNRYRVTNDFGYAALDINFLVGEDAGEYTLVVKNDAGEANTATVIEIESGALILDETSHPESLRRIQEIEGVKPAEPEEEEQPPEAPQFTEQLQTPQSEEIVEGQPLHMDCTVIPINDNKLRIEWFFNGQPLQFSSRIRTIHDFGYVALEFLHIHPEDSGTYTCRAINEAGEAETSLDLNITGKKNIYLETQHEESWNKIYEMENRVIEREPSPELVFPPPNFTQQLNTLDELTEGDHIRLECRLQPVNDPTLKVTWTVNGQPLPEASRWIHSRNMDLIVLDVPGVVGEDSGLYSCHAVSAFGEATTSTTLKVTPTDALLLDTQHQESWNQIQEIENRQPPELIVPEPEKVAPKFVNNLPQLPAFEEGDPIHIEGQIEPTDDNQLVVEWFFNGQPLSNGHRYRTVHDFGYVSLDILYAFAQDSGTYTCVARNELGEATSETTIDVASHQILYLDPQHPSSWQKIQELEAPKEQPEEAEPAPAEPPKFIEPLEALQRIGGQPAHFKTRVTPNTDPKLVVTWFKDGQPLKNSNRFRHTYDFGLVALDIAYTVAEDAGTYTAVAKNESGEDQINVELSVEEYGTILSDPQHEASWQRVQELEAPKEKPEEEAEPEHGPPHFVTQIQSVTDLIEGQPAHFEAQVQPINDPNLRIQWFHNGRPLPASNRFGIRNDFGLVSLDIHYVLGQDIGDYRCQASNAYGQDSTEAHLECERRPGILSDTQHEESWRRIQEIEAPKSEQPEAEPTVYPAPQFTQPLQSIADASENSIVVFEGRVIPINDPNLQLQWFRDDTPLQQSNRYVIVQDFGHVALRINGVTSFDNGVYSCKAVNNEGATITNASLSVAGSENIIVDTAHPASLQKIEYMEGIDKNPRLEYPEQQFDKPNWVQTFENVEVEDEGGIIKLTGYVDPADDPELRIEWFLNNVPLQNSNRHHNEINFGQVVFTIIHVLPHDSGVYTCRAFNQHGEASTSATVKVSDYEAILRNTQHPESWERIQELEAPKIIEEIEVVEEKEKPRFLTHLEDASDIQEGTPIHLEATFQPARDNDLKVEWQFNGQPLGASQLIKTRSELGWAALDISAVNPDHEGVYTLKIVNTEGDASTSATLRIAGIGEILGDTTHEESWRQIQILEAPKEKEPTPPPAEYDAPTITTEISDIECDEGDSSAFEAVVQPTNDPNLKVQWVRNGEPLSHGSKYAISQDFGLCKLAIGYTFPEDAGVFQLKVSNDKGEAVSSATLKCNAKEAILGDVQHEESWRRIQEIEAPKEPEPEKEPEPKVPPKFTSPIQNVAELQEGQPAHFETTVEPINDPELEIKWFVNGEPFAASSRAKFINDFGWVILNINSTELRDTGEWVCVASNSAGEDRVSTNLSVTGHEGIASDAIQAQSLARIQEIEAPKAGRPEEEAPQFESPNITVQLSAPSDLSEGDSVHLEAHYTPSNDPRLVVTWYKDGQILPQANRYKMVNDFGFAILDILYVLAHDSGEYTVVVSNEQGEASTSATLSVEAKDGLVLDPLDEGKARAVQELEDLRNRRPEVEDLAPEERVPVFVQPLSAPAECETGDRAHFTAKYEPINDNTLEVQWYLNGRALLNSSRVKTINDFGFVVLEISPVIPEDSGEYTCRARNKAGEAVTSTTLTCTPKDNIVRDTQLPDRMKGAQQKIEEIESRGPKPEEEPELVFAPPKFKNQLQQLPQLREGALIHLDVPLEPVNDPKLRVEWFHNGEPVRDSNRMKTIHDFGFVVLELIPAEPQDTGNWTCRATNDYGQDEVSVDVEVVGDSGILYDWVAPGEKKDKIEQLEQYINRPRGDLVQPDVDYEAPHFTENLTDLGEHTETDATSFMCVLEPIGDPSLNIEWQHNGHSIPYSNRIQMTNDFGVLTLTIKHLIAQDSGEYKCIARNDKGEAITSGTIEVRTIIDAEEPQIVQPLVENIDADQGESIHLETRVLPINDPKLKVEWWRNGALLPEANRYKTNFEFGFVTLDILYAYPEDNGDYELRVINDKGQASTVAHVNVLAKPSLEFAPQAPGATAENIEHHIRQFTRADIALSEDDAYDPANQRAPEFKTQLLNIGVEEGDFCRFETQVAPLNDPYLKIEWYRDGKPVNIGNRFRNNLEFGYVSLDLLYALPDDTGEYTCVATNQFGQAVATAKLACSTASHVITESQLPQSLKVRDIKKQNENLHWVDQKGVQARQKQAPQFTISPRNIQVTENEPARFECAVVGNPKPKVIWYVNGIQALQGQRYKLNYDGVHYLTITHARISDAGTIEAIAKNSEGEVIASANLDVFQRDDFRQQKLKKGTQKTNEELQERVNQWQKETLGQLGEAFEQKPKANVNKLVRVERSKHPVEPLETEELVQKFTRTKDDQFYDKLSYVERERKQFGGLELEPISLKPGQIQKYQPEREQLEPVQLREVDKPKEEKDPQRFRSPPPDWAAGNVKLGEPVGKVNQMEEPEPEVVVPARDQVKLRGAKPKPAAELPSNERVRIQEEKAKIRQPQQGPEIEKEKVIPHKDQVNIKQKFAPKEIGPTDHVVVESGPLKGTPQVVKDEIPRVTVANKPQPTKQVQSQKSAPSIQNQLQPVQAELGRSARFAVNFSGDAPVTVKWYLNGKELRSAFDTQIKTTDGESVLELNKLKYNHQGEYTVKLSNVGGQAESTANLTVGEPSKKGTAPAFSQIISDQRAAQNSSVTFSCTVSGDPPTVSWFKDGKPLPNDSRFERVQNGSNVGLTLNNVVAPDAGVYECVAKNPAGEARCKARLNVNLTKTGKGAEAGPKYEAPRFSTPLQPIVASAGQAAEFRAQFTGFPGNF
ncbi:unnamed protein product [Bursaphelenchus okinawaensis]|uniref:Ig-like domain-containing protein n=1 Tax=Bursaphelenchus okinawaensis TaxID=465554 RepID=A0A811LAD3_9BILA|nr:unnamed protein product [Bursaphelenchus okinawaensis]CAG9119647.1 unnamed protein product [Bursaphelenchus okinawaensis]